MPDLSIAIAAAGDDGYEFFGPGWIAGSASGSAGVNVGMLLYGGWRFLNVLRDSPVFKAELVIEVTSVTSSPTLLVSTGPHDDAAAYGTSDLPSAEANTGQVGPIGGWVVGENRIDVTTPFNEIMARPGWVSGNAIRFKAFNSGASGTAFVNFDCFEAAGSDQAVLDVTFAKGGGVSSDCSPATTMPTAIPTVCNSTFKSS